MNFSFLEIIYSNLVCTGLIYGIGAVGLGLIYKYLKFPDFTTTGAISAGAISMVVFSEYNIILGFFLSLVIGAFLGYCTYLQIRFIKIPPILAGIITWVFSFAVMYYLSGGEASITPEESTIDKFGLIISPDDNIWNFVIIMGIAISIAYLVSLAFKTKYGLFILAMLGTDNYLKHRHKDVNKAYFVLLVFGNAIISLAGSLLAITTNVGHIAGVPEFLVIALSGFVFAQFIILLLSRKNTKKYLETESKPSKWFFTLFLIIRDKLNLNDEHPTKIFLFLFFVIIGSTVVQSIFQYIDNNGADFSRSQSYLYKALIFFGLLAIMQFYKFISNYKSSKYERL